MNHRTPAEERLAAQLAAAPAVLARIHVHLFGQDGICIVCDLDIVTWSEDAELDHIAIEGNAVMTGRYGHQRFTATQVSIDPAVAKSAALTLCDRATDAADARQMLEACGLVEYRAEVAAS